MFAKLMNVFLPEGKRSIRWSEHAVFLHSRCRHVFIHGMGQKEDPTNYLLMHAVSANVGGQIGSVVAGGLILTLVPLFF
jgi:oxaloacetate decarboxylase beta subunit